ncbi:MAG: translation initiation factor IF-3 [Actinomycetes bacterium]
MAVPRRLDRRMPERDQTRTNERIRVPEVRLVGPDGEQVGVLKTPDALAYAQDRDLDLVEVAPDAKPPVCRVLDYSKYRYEQVQKQKAARKHQQTIVVREIKFRPKIAQHDYETKVGHIKRFLRHKDKVKITIMFRGREMAHPDRGRDLLNRIAEELTEFAVVEQNPLQDGRNMTMMIAPSKTLLGEIDVEERAKAKADGNGGKASSKGGKSAAKAMQASAKSAKAAAAATSEATAETATKTAAEPVAEAPAEPAEKLPVADSD